LPEGDNTFGFITMVCSYPFVYAVPKDSPIKSFPDMLARAKVNPGKLSYVITSLGAVYHLIGTWVNGKAGVDMVPSLIAALMAVADVWRPCGRDADPPPPASRPLPASSALR
jgi:hypothetical protein